MNRAQVVTVVAAVNRLADVILLSKSSYEEAAYCSKREMERDYIIAAERQLALADQLSLNPERRSGTDRRNNDDQADGS